MKTIVKTIVKWWGNRKTKDGRKVYELAEARSYTLLWMENPLRVFSLIF